MQVRRLQQSPGVPGLQCMCQTAVPTESKISVHSSVSWQALCWRESYLSCWQVVKQTKPLKWWLVLDDQAVSSGQKSTEINCQKRMKMQSLVQQSQQGRIQVFYNKASCLRRYFTLKKTRPHSRRLLVWWIQLRVVLSCTERTMAQGNETLILQVFSGMVCSASIGPGVYCKGN